MYSGKMIAVSTLLGLSGCASWFGGGGTAWQMTPSSGAASAMGTVKTKTVDNGNTQVKVNVRHLAHPNAVEPKATVYVVWARPIGDSADGGSGRLQNLGALRIDKDREAELKAVTPLKQMQVLITPEAIPTVQAPTAEPILQGRILQQ